MRQRASNPASRCGVGRTRHALLAGAAALLATGAAAADGLKPYQATYQGIWHGMTVAVSNLKLENSGDAWTYTSKSAGRGLGKLVSGLSPDQTSVVKVIADGGIQPQSYHSGGGDAKHTIDLKYDWQAKRLTGSYEGTAVDLALTPEVQDDASVQLALMSALLAGHAPDKFQLIDKNSVRDYRFTRDGEATLKTPLGDVTTVVYRAQKKNSPRITRFWCAPDKGFVPMKVEQTKGDDVQWTLQIESLKR